MTKEEMIVHLKDGKKITHRYFESREFMQLRNGRIYFEEGQSISEEAFWHYRKDPCWEDGWELKQ